MTACPCDPDSPLGRVLGKARELASEVRQIAERVHDMAEESHRLTATARRHSERARQLAETGRQEARAVKHSIVWSLDTTSEIARAPPCCPEAQTLRDDLPMAD